MSTLHAQRGSCIIHSHGFGTVCVGTIVKTVLHAKRGIVKGMGHDSMVNVYGCSVCREGTMVGSGGSVMDPVPFTEWFRNQQRKTEERKQIE